MSENLAPVDNLSVAAGAENTHQLPATVHENLLKLHEFGEVGAYLASVYLAALDISPDLSDVVLNPYDSANMRIPGTAGRATPPYYSDSGHPEVSFNATSWDEYADLMRSRPTTVAEIARKLGIGPEQVSPELFSAFTLGHELGHVEDWRAKGFNRTGIEAVYDEELDTLPIPGVAAATIVAWVARDPERAEQYVMTHKDHLAELGITTVSELVAAQDLAYRSIPSEDMPDQFAVAVMASMNAK